MFVAQEVVVNNRKTVSFSGKNVPYHCIIHTQSDCWTRPSFCLSKRVCYFIFSYGKPYIFYRKQLKKILNQILTQAEKEVGTGKFNILLSLNITEKC